MSAYQEQYYTARYDYRPTSMYWWSTRYYQRLVTKYAPRPGTRLLEIGYGMGHLLGSLEKGFQTTGVDISSYAETEAARNAPRTQLMQGNIEEGLDYPPGHFGVIVAKHVFEHVVAPARVLAECARLLEPGGLLFFGTPNPTSVGAKWKGPAWVGWSDSTHISVLPPDDWVRLTREAGFRVRRAFGDGLWDVPYVRWLPRSVQRAVFGWPALLQIFTSGTWMPVKLGESVLVIAYKK